MSIIIQNLGAVDEISADDPMGERQYVIKINSNVIVYYTHSRKDGLAECLRKAATAIETNKNNLMMNSIDYFLKNKG